MPSSVRVAELLALIRRRFWTQLLEKAKAKSSLHRAVSPGDYSWIGAGSGRSGLTFNYSVTQHGSKVELYIDRGRGAEEENARIFDALSDRRDEIERSFGRALNWEPLEGKRACRISQAFELGGYKDEERWPEIQEEMVDAMILLERTLKPQIARLPN